MNSLVYVFRATVFLFVFLAVLSSASAEDFWCPAGIPLGYGQNSRIETDSKGHIFCLGTAVHRSTDSGRSWQTSPMPMRARYSDDDLESAGDGVLIIGNDQVYRSVDDGKSWTVISPTPDHTGYAFVSAVSTGTIALPVRDTVYISHNRGDTWQYHVVAVDTWFITRVMASPNGDVYAADYVTSDGLYVMRKDSTEWVQLPTQDIGTFRLLAVSDGDEVYAITDSNKIARFDPVTQSWRISADKPDDHVAGGKILPDGRVYAWTYKFLYTTNDEGITWQRADSGLPKDRGVVVRDLSMGKGREVYVSTYEDGLFMLPSGKQVWQPIGSDMEAVTVDKLETSQKGNRLFALSYYSGSNGVYSSDDGGATWQHTSLLRETDGSKISYIRTRDMVRATNGTLYVCGSDDIFMSDDNGDSWSRTDIPNIGFTTLNVAADGSLVAARTQYGHDKDIARSTDGGVTWTTVLTGYEFLPPIVQGEGTTLFANSRSGLLRSPDNGETWKRVEIPEAKQGFQPFDIVHTGDGQLFLGANWGVWRSLDNGVNWSVSSIGRGSYYRILSTKHGYVYAAGVSAAGTIAVVRTEDGGITWQDISAGLTDEDGAKVRALAEDADSRLYAGGSFAGVVKNCVATSVEEHAPVLAATPSISCFPNPSSGRMNISYQLPSPGYVSVKLVDLAGRNIAVLTDEWKPAGAYTREWEYDLPEGMYMLVLSSGTQQAVCRVYCR